MTTEIIQRLSNYAPRRLSAREWAHAREVAVDAVLSTSPGSGQIALAEISFLANFLAWHRMRDRKSAPDLTALLANAHIDRYVATDPSHQSAQPFLRRLGRSVGAVPQEAQIKAIKRRPNVERFWPRVVMMGPFTALAVAYQRRGNALMASMFTNIVSTLASDAWDLANLKIASASDEVTGTMHLVRHAACELRAAPDATLREVIVAMSTKKVAKLAQSKPLSRSAQMRAAKAAMSAHEAAVVAAQSPSEISVAELPELSPELAETIAVFRPHRFTDEEWSQVAVATRALATAYQPASVNWLRTQSGTFARFCRWVATRPERVDLGSELRTFEVLESGLVEQYLMGPLATSPDNSRATVRSVLRRGVDRLSAVPKVTVAYRSVQAPYTPFECASFMRLAKHQPTSATRRGLSAMVALGLGAGLAANEQRAISPDRISEVDLGEGVTGLLIDVPGERARSVIVREAYEELLREAVALHRAERRADSAPLYGNKSGRRNATTGVRQNAQTALGDGVDIDVARLRSTWLVACMSAEVPLGALLRASGLRSARTLVELLSHCPLPSEDSVARTLRAVESAGSGASLQVPTNGRAQ